MRTEQQISKMSIIYILLLAYISTILDITQSACVEGYQSSQGNFWFVCSKGNLVPIACISPDGDRIEEGSSYQTSKLLLQCSRDPRNPAVLTLAPVACINHGVSVNVGDTVTNDQTQVLKCSQDGNTLSLKAAGCIGDDGKVIPNGNAITRADGTYTCSAGGPGTQLVPKSCSYSGTQYPIGATLDSSGVWFKCEQNNDGSLALKIKGCINNGTRYEIGQRYKDYYFVYECQFRAGTALAAGVGCVERYPNGTVTEYKPGDKWLVGSGVYNWYQILCKQEGLIIRRQGVACYYKTKDGEGFLQGGCMRQVGFQVLQCTAPTPQTPNVRIRVTENPTEADWTRLRGTGLKLC